MLTAELRINELESASLVAYFKDLSSTWWAGWEGEKTYRSLEGQLSLATSHHVRGHIGLKVCLRGYIGETAWEASGALDLEGSQLDQLAHDASLVFLREKAG